MSYNPLDPTCRICGAVAQDDECQGCRVTYCETHMETHDLFGHEGKRGKR